MWDKTFLDNSALPEESRLFAQFIAFAPFVFQTAKCMRNLGVLAAINEEPGGVGFGVLLEKTKLSDYSLSVLLDASQSCGILFQKESKYLLTQAGQYLLSDKLTNVNFNFTNDVCYQSLVYLEDSFRTGKPEGLKVFGDWKTIYEGLTKIPETALKSWLEFDHYYSDDALPKILSVVCKESPKRILDVGGNTGKFAIACAKYNESVSITMIDHPEQLKIAKKNISSNNLADRIEMIPMNLLENSTPFPKGHDAIFMSQFLDCFDPDQILKILQRAEEAMDDEAQLFIVEPFIDRQRYQAAQFCLNMTSLYFTCLANGNSRMYRSLDFSDLIEKANLCVVEEINNIRLSHTVLICQRKTKNL